VNIRLLKVGKRRYDFFFSDLISDHSHNSCHRNGLHNDLAVRRVGPEHTTAPIGSPLDGKRKTLTKDHVCYASAGVA
jgi:hypothetical protein